MLELLIKNPVSHDKLQKQLKLEWTINRSFIWEKSILVEFWKDPIPFTGWIGGLYCLHIEMDFIVVSELQMSGTASSGVINIKSRGVTQDIKGRHVYLLRISW